MRQGKSYGIIGARDEWTRFLSPRYLWLLFLHHFRPAPSVEEHFRRGLWLFRYGLRFAKSLLRPSSKRRNFRTGTGLDGCEVLYINLKHRTDRRVSIEEQLEKLGVTNPRRIEGRRNKNGALGCAMSHVAALQSPGNHGGLLMVCEDDLIFTATRAAIDDCIKAFVGNPALDVLCLSHNLGEAPSRVSRLLSITKNTQTTACYVVKERARQDLLESFEGSALELSAGSDVRFAAIDVRWKSLQVQNVFFAVPNFPICHQGPAYSDIENRFVDYGG